MTNTGIFLFDLTQILISKKFEIEIVFESSVSAWIRIRIRNRIRIEQKCWIRIRIKSIRIHNLGKNVQAVLALARAAACQLFKITNSYHQDCLLYFNDSL
jgi:hypothetical protein